jgi:Domain of unknown function (DUF4136)
MRIRNFAAAAALGLAALGLSACATGLNTQVSRYQPAAIPAGASYYVVPKQGAADPQFYRYASMVSQQLAAQGFHPAGSPQAADVLVKLDYGVDEGTTQIERDPYYGPGFGRGFGPYGFGDPFYDPFWGVYYGRPYFSRWGGSPFYYGWDDPFSYYGGYGGYGGPFGYDRFREYTVYKSYLDMDIVRRGDNAPLFEGHAKARSQTDELDKLVPNLVTAMFTGFPGRNGETVKITVPARRKS